MSRNLGLPVAALLLLTALAGCAADDPTIRIALVPADDDVAESQDPQRLAAWMEDQTGRPVDLYEVTSTETVLSSLLAGQADIAFVDGAAGWWGWQRFDLDVLASDTRSDGRDHYIASAWVTDAEAYPTMASLEGARSCHTGLYKSAGMFMPLGWMIGNDLVDVVGDPEDLSAIEPTVRAFFSEAQIGGGIYDSYQGAMRCLSDGTGDVAFVRDTSPEDFCGEANMGDRDWCLPVADYTEIQQFGKVPNHPVMADPFMDADKRADILAALLALNDSDQGRVLLDEVLQTDALVATDAETHLGDYGANLIHVPGIQTYVQDKIS